MGVIIIVPVLALFCALWGFFKFPPALDRPGAIHAFNRMVLGLGAVLWALWYFSISERLAKVSLLKYKWLLGIGGGAAAAFVYVCVFFCVRNFWLFADPNRQHRRF